MQKTFPICEKYDTYICFIRGKSILVSWASVTGHATASHLSNPVSNSCRAVESRWFAGNSNKQKGFDKIELQNQMNGGKTNWIVRVKEKKETAMMRSHYGLESSDVLWLKVYWNGKWTVMYLLIRDAIHFGPNRKKVSL